MGTAGYVEAHNLVVPSGESILVAANSGGPTAVGLTAGTYSITTLCAMLVTILTAGRPVTLGAWSVSIAKTGSSPTGKVTISVSAGTFSITWTSTNLRDILGFTNTITAQTTSTGANQAKGIWFPYCVVTSDSDLRYAPLNTRRRTSISPQGRTTSARGTASFEHSGLLWNTVNIARVWTYDETTVNASYETFVKDCLLNHGHAWFTYNGSVTIVDHRELAAGVSASISSWDVADLPELKTIRMQRPGWPGLWTITWPLITSDG